MKSLKGEANLFELRPKKGGACGSRPIYARFGAVRDSGQAASATRTPRRRLVQTTNFFMLTILADQTRLRRVALLGQQMGQHAPQIPADLPVVRFDGFGLKPSST